MSTSSKLGVAFLFCFGLAFAGMGGAFMLKCLSAPQTMPNSTAGAIFAGGFALIGLLIMGGTLYAASKLKQDDEAKAAHPDSPWLWRQDWAQSRVYGRQNNRAAALWVATIVVGCLTLPWIFIASHPDAHKAAPPLIFFLVLGSFAPLTAVSAIIATIRRERYGKTYFEFDSLPISPGKKMTGRIELHLASGAQHGIDVRLCCVRRITTGSGKEQSTHDEILWEQEQNVPSNLLGFGAVGTSVPVSFDVPADAYESNSENPRDKVLWLLRAKADVTGVDFKEEYELPVFRTAASSAPSAATSSNSVFTTSFGAAAAPVFAMQAESGPVERPAKTSAVISTDWNGTQMYFPPLRNPASTLALFGIAAAWTAVVYFLPHSEAPKFFFTVFGCVDVLLLLALFSAIFSSTRITLSGDTLTRRKSFLGLARTKAIPFSEIAEIHPYSGFQQNTNIFYGLRLTTKSGRKLNLVNGIADRQEARWLVSQIESAAGLKQDTRVETPNFYGPPPQRGVPPSPATRKAPGWVAVVFMLIWIGFIFGRVLIPGFSHSAKSNAARSKSASRPAIQVVPRRFSPITEADLARISALPVQDQAEDLLERSIGHDPRALDIFNSHYADYKGEVKQSPRMQQLLNRAQYSTDLRVRYAYSDMMLAMEGWSKDSEAVSILLGRAKNDPSSRAYDMWYLGMLGGRGVETEQVQNALYDYARTDPDAKVRQAAAEGLRFLGTDQALDDLFQIFTTDASFSVRDRAGCNISDCGDFMRKQRMRIFPKLLELAEAPDTNAQMRNWSFLAMQEIADVGLPANAKAWHQWYDQHGAEKMAQFQSMPEWQVRGDE
ncbi:MAG TPA: HEAT repeat domain-containing protein [Terriglobales bacterium]|nr:HEAT repeat domain-containing protein [Terriglobales bacterium]